MPVVYDSYEDVVDEQYDPALDGDDGDEPGVRTTLLSPLSARLDRLRLVRLSAPTPSLVVPFVAVKEGNKERNAVYAVKRAYARSQGGLRLRKLMAKPLEVRRSWGPGFTKEFGQKTYTRARHEALAPHYDAFALSLLRADQPEMSARDKQIAVQMGWHDALYNRRMSVIYSQLRPSQLGWASLITRADCSGSVAAGCHWAKIMPGVDWRYTNTWIQIHFGQRVSGVSAAKPGDVFLYGSPSHEALYLGGGLVWSFGSYPIKILRWNYRRDLNQIRRFVP